MTTVFSNFSPKIRKTSIFGPQFKDFCFCTNIWNETNLRALISNMTMVFQNCCPKHPNKAFLVPNLRILVFVWNFAFRKIRCYFKYGNSFFSNFYYNFRSKFKDWYFILLRLYELLRTFTKWKVENLNSFMRAKCISSWIN